MIVVSFMESSIDCFHFLSGDFRILRQKFPSLKWLHARNKKDFHSKLAEAEICFCWEFPRENYDLAPNVKHIFTPAAGKDWIFPPPSKRIVQIHHGTFHGEMIAESFLAMVFHFNNKMNLLPHIKHQRNWPRNAWTGRSMIKGQKLLIIGYGNIGREVAKKSQALGIEVKGLRRTPEKSTELKGCPIYPLSEIEKHIQWAQHILLLLPGDARGFITQELIAKMRPGAFLYNFGRGGTVNDTDIAAFLRSGHLAGAGLDVSAIEPLPVNSTLWEAPNLLLTPHSSCCYEEYRAAFLESCISPLKEILQ